MLYCPNFPRHEAFGILHLAVEMLCLMTLATVSAASLPPPDPTRNAGLGPEWHCRQPTKGPVLLLQQGSRHHRTLRPQRDAESTSRHSEKQSAFLTLFHVLRRRCGLSFRQDGAPPVASPRVIAATPQTADRSATRRPCRGRRQCCSNGAWPMPPTASSPFSGPPLSTSQAGAGMPV